ncbi:hypothetical protein CB1_001161020 [Camelus ferus]|nr:hypothetical protein CB1_001161020 [Camelus ferus]
MPKSKVVVDALMIENYIVENMKSEMAQIQQNAVQNHTATMLEIGTSLLSQTAEQTRKLTDVETQVLNQTSRLEIQLLENSLSTYKLEKQLLQQTNEILKIHEKNSLLEHKILEMEGKHKEELDTLKEEKENLQGLVTRQTYIIQELEKQLNRATNNNSVLQKQQLELMDTVHNLVNLCTKEGDYTSKSHVLQVHGEELGTVFQSPKDPDGTHHLQSKYCEERARDMFPESLLPLG